MDKVVIDLETFNKVMNVLGQLPYSQVAGLLQEVGNSAEQVNGINDIPSADVGASANDSDSGNNSVHLEDQE